LCTGLFFLLSFFVVPHRALVGNGFFWIVSY
jgi:hypothetical protein